MNRFANMPVMYSLLPKPVELRQHPDVLWLGIWTGSRSVHEAVKCCWNAGLRNRHLLPPESWTPCTIH